MKKDEMQEKGLKLLPSLREKRHYLVLVTERAEKEAETAIKQAILDFIGAFGYAKAGVLFVEKGKVNNGLYFILSITTKYVNAVKAALALAEHIRCIGVSGTIKKAREKFLNRVIAYQ